MQRQLVLALADERAQLVDGPAVIALVMQREFEIGAIPTQGRTESSAAPPAEEGGDHGRPPHNVRSRTLTPVTIQTPTFPTVRPNINRVP